MVTINDVVDYLKANPKVSQKKLRKDLGMSRTTCSKKLKYLENIGEVVLERSKKDFRANIVYYINNTN